MGNQENKQSLRKSLEDHLNSPATLLTKLKQLIFGTVNPDMYTQISFFIGLVITLIFLVWNFLGYLVIDGRNWIEAEKGLDIEVLIAQRGGELGFEPGQFIQKLETFYFFAVVLWCFIFVGLIFQWRKQTIFIYIIGISAILYLIGMWAYLGFDYWLEDTTLFDKVLFILLIGHSLLYAYFLNKEVRGEKINFFGLDDEDN